MCSEEAGFNTGVLNCLHRNVVTSERCGRHGGRLIRGAIDARSLAHYGGDLVSKQS